MTTSENMPEAQTEEPRANTFMVLSQAGPHRDHTKGSREQPHWDAHAAFIDRLVAERFILLGGPLVDEGGALLIVVARDEAEVRATLHDDPWYEHGLLQLESVKRWQIFIDEWQLARGA
jgi:uncharacterized protein YciI